MLDTILGLRDRVRGEEGMVLGITLAGHSQPL